MTTINCLANCVYQFDGKCCFENIDNTIVTPNSNCAYYLSANPKEATSTK